MPLLTENGVFTPIAFPPISTSPLSEFYPKLVDCMAAMKTENNYYMCFSQGTLQYSGYTMTYFARRKCNKADKLAATVFKGIPTAKLPATRWRWGVANTIVKVRFYGNAT